MIVIADTSPLNYLAQLNAAYLLRDLFGELVMPHAVQIELQKSGSPPTVQA